MSLTHSLPKAGKDWNRVMSENRYARHFPKAGEAMNKETERGATVPPESPGETPVDDDSGTPTAPRLLSPAEVREIAALVEAHINSAPLGWRAMMFRLCDSYETAIAAITVFGAWVPFLENIDIRGVQDDADYNEFAEALSTLAALAQQLGEEP
jgi:hypothetical protein